jgi:hypothetical protein
MIALRASPRLQPQVCRSQTAMAEVPTRSHYPLYRILDFHRVVQLFEDRELHFSHPSIWQDPYETKLRHRFADRVFAQCWCTHGVSDAMWRIYSPNSLGVRIRTSRFKLEQTLRAARLEQRFDYRIKKVKYMRETDLNYQVEAIADELAQNFSLTNALEPLFLKRLPFKHETELRAVLFVKNGISVDPKLGFKVPVEPHMFMESILVDPRAPDEFVRMYRHHLESQYQFAGRVQKSSLYADTDPLEV